MRSISTRTWRDYVTTSQSGGGETVLGVPNPNEKQGGTDEFSASIEREMIPNLAVRFTGIYSKTFNFQRLQNNKRPYDVYTIPITNRDPGPDNTLGTPDDPGTSITYYDFPAQYAGIRFQEPMLINDPNADQRFKSYEIALSRRLSNRWQFYASYSFTKKEVPFIPNTGGGSFLNINTFNPNSEINNDDNTTEWLGRVSGSYLPALQRDGFCQLRAPEREPAAPHRDFQGRAPDPPDYVARGTARLRLAAAEPQHRGPEHPEDDSRARESQRDGAHEYLQRAQRQHHHGADDDVRTELRAHHRHPAAADCGVGVSFKF